MISYLFLSLLTIATLIIKNDRMKKTNKSTKGKILDELISPKEKTNFQHK